MSATSLSDQINQTVGKATREELDMDDWDSIILLCDLLAQKPDEASPIVIKAVIDQLRNDNPKIQRLALTLLDSCVKNAGDYFHRTLCLPKNLIIIEKLARSDDVGHRVREIVAEWSREFGVRMPEFHRSLARINGEESPLRVEPTDTAARTTVRSPAYYENLTQQPQQQQLEERFEDPAEKIRADMDVVRETAKVLRDMVAEADSVDDIKDRSCVQIIVNCREMHRRLIELIESEPEERLLLELIDLNDELYSAIEEHDHFKRTGTKKQRPKDKVKQGNGRSDTGARQEEENLFDLAETNQNADSLVAVQASRTTSQPATDLDMFLFGPPIPETSASATAPSISENQNQQQQQQQHSDLPVGPFASLLISPPSGQLSQSQQQQQQQQQNKNVDDNLNPFL